MAWTALTGYGEKDLSLEQNAVDATATDIIAVFNHEEDDIATANEGDQKEFNLEDQGVPKWNAYVQGMALVNRTEGVDAETAAPSTSASSMGKTPSPSHSPSPSLIKFLKLATHGQQS